MNGVMPNQQYMPSPHGLSKSRHHTSNQYTKNSQVKDLSEYSNENINTEVYKTPHVLMGDCKLLSRGHVFPRASSVKSCFDSVCGCQNGDQQNVFDANSCIAHGQVFPLASRDHSSLISVSGVQNNDQRNYAKATSCIDPSHVFPLTSSVESSLDSFATFLNKGHQTVVENSITNLKPRHVTNGNSCRTLKKICGDDTVQSARCFEGYLQTDMHSEPVQSSLYISHCSLVSCKSGKNNAASMELEPECDLKWTVSDSYTLENEKSFHCKRQNIASIKLEQKFNSEWSDKEIFPSDFMRSGCNERPKASIAQTKPEPKTNIESTVSDSFSSDFMPRSLCERLFEQEYFVVVHESDKLTDIAATLKPSVNISSKLMQISNVRCDFSERGKTEKIKPRTKNMLVKNLNSKSRIPRQTYANIVKRLPDYKPFSKVFQKAVRNVKQHKNYFQTTSPTAGLQSNITFNDYLKTYELNAIKDKNIFKKFQLNIVQDMDELDEFLDYVSRKISELILVIRSITNDLQLLDVKSEDISVPLHYLQNTHFFNENNLITSTRSEMLELGGNLLKKIRSLKHKWKHILKVFKKHLVIVSRSLYTLCSMPIETKVIHERDIVFGLVDKIDNLIQDIEVSEKELEVHRARNFKELLELQTSLKKFHDMDSLLDELC